MPGGPPPPATGYGPPGYNNRGYSDNYGSDQSRMMGMSSPMSSASGAGPAVVMVYGMVMEKMNADRLFNLLCQYGNVNKIKFLKTKEGSAMVEMGDSVAVERAVHHLNFTMLFESKLTLGFSKQSSLQPVQSPYQLPDGTPSYKDYLGSRNNRFSTPESAAKNRIQPPTKILHYYNTPPNMPEEELKGIFISAGLVAPSKVKQFPSKSERSSTGLIEFEEVSDALAGLVVCNHHPIDTAATEGKTPYIFKICFSNSPISDRA